MTEKQRLPIEKAIQNLTAAYEQQRNRRPLEDTDTIAVYYGDLRKLIEYGS